MKSVLKWSICSGGLLFAGSVLGENPLDGIVAYGGTETIYVTVTATTCPEQGSMPPPGYSMNTVPATLITTSQVVTSILPPPIETTGSTGTAILPPPIETSIPPVTTATSIISSQTPNTATPTLETEPPFITTTSVELTTASISSTSVTTGATTSTTSAGPSVPPAVGNAGKIGYDFGIGALALLVAGVLY